MSDPKLEAKIWKPTTRGEFYCRLERVCYQTKDKTHDGDFDGYGNSKEDAISMAYRWLLAHIMDYGKGKNEAPMLEEEFLARVSKVQKKKKAERKENNNSNRM